MVVAVSTTVSSNIVEVLEAIKTLDPSAKPVCFRLIRNWQGDGPYDIGRTERLIVAHLRGFDRPTKAKADRALTAMDGIAFLIKASDDDDSAR